MVTVVMVQAFVLGRTQLGVLIDMEWTEATIHPEHVSALLSGMVVFSVPEGVCTLSLTKNRLVITHKSDCWIYIFPQPLLDEFVTQLDALSETAGAQ